MQNETKKTRDTEPSAKAVNHNKYFKIYPMFDQFGNETYCHVSGSDKTPEGRAALQTQFYLAHMQQEQANVIARAKQQYHEFYASLSHPNLEVISDKLGIGMRLNLNQDQWNLYVAAKNLADYIEPPLAAEQWLHESFFERGENITRQAYNKLSVLRKALVCFGYMIQYQKNDPSKSYLMPELLLDGSQYNVWLGLKPELKTQYEFPVGYIFFESNVADEDPEPVAVPSKQRKKGSK